MPIYLDNNATTQLDERVLEVMLPYLRNQYGNASSVHRYGRLMRTAIENARAQIGALVGVHSSQVIFTGSGTEANNLALRGVIGRRQIATIAISSIEHASMREPAFDMRKDGWRVEEVGVDQQGYVSQEMLQTVLSLKPVWLSVMTANNETGVIQDITSIAVAAQEIGTVFHTDASQAAGKIPLDFDQFGVQLMTLSSHKLYGPLGAGALIIDKKVELQPLLIGGGHEKGLRAGTENVAAIVGFGAAAQLTQQMLESSAVKMLQLRKQLEQGLNTIPAVRIFAQQSKRLPNTVLFGVIGCHGETLLMQLDRRGIAVSSGSACRSHTHEPSHVLTAMAVEPELGLTAIRASIGRYNTEQDIAKFIETLAGIVSTFSNANVDSVRAVSGLRK